MSISTVCQYHTVTWNISPLSKRTRSVHVYTHACCCILWSYSCARIFGINGYTLLLFHLLSFITCWAGGDVNVKDDDDETPLFTVESVDMARWLVEHGASLDCRNQEGKTVRPHGFHEMPAKVNTVHIRRSLPNISLKNFLLCQRIFTP